MMIKQLDANLMKSATQPVKKGMMKNYFINNSVQQKIAMPRMDIKKDIKEERFSVPIHGSSPTKIQPNNVTGADLDNGYNRNPLLRQKY